MHFLVSYTTLARFGAATRVPLEKRRAAGIGGVAVAANTLHARSAAVGQPTIAAEPCDT